MRQAAHTTQSLLESRPFPPAEALVRHVELVAKFGSLPNLASNGRQFSWIRFYNIDIFVFIGFLLFTTLFLLCKFVMFLYKSKASHPKTE